MNKLIKHRNVPPAKYTGGILRCCFFAAIALACFPACVYSSVFKARIIPEDPKGGEALYLRISGPAECKYEADFGGKQYNLFVADAGKLELMIPLKIESKGAKKIVLKALKDDKVAEKKQFEIYVSKRKIRVIKLTESGEQMRDSQPSVPAQQESVLDAINTVSPVRLWTTEFQKPLRTSGNGNFAVKREGKKYSYYHKGVDIDAREGAPVLAANSGKIVLAVENLNIYGNAIVIDHGEGLVSCYFHLKKLLKYKGDDVAAGEPIAEVGSTGWATGPHLHFAVYLMGDPIDPLWWINFSREVIKLR